MKVQIKPDFLFHTKYWTAEFNENIEGLQKECFFITNNDNDGTKIDNTGFQASYSKEIKNFEFISEIKK